MNLAADFKRKLAILVTIVAVAAIMIAVVTVAYWLSQVS